MQVQLNLLFDPSETNTVTSYLRLINQVSSLDDAAVNAFLARLSPTQPREQSAIPPNATLEALKTQRQAQAAAARAAKVAKQQAQPAGPRMSGGLAQTPVDDLTGTNGQDQSDDEDMGLDPPTSMSPGEARDAALALVREVYSAGHVAEVKALQKALNVAKFYDVPVTDGHSLYARVMKLAQSTGLRQ